MFYVYILKSLKDKRTYVGHSDDISRRLVEHNKGQVGATKRRRPLELLFIENCDTQEIAKQRELYWKSGAGRRKLKNYFETEFPPIVDGRGSPK